MDKKKFRINLPGQNPPMPEEEPEVPTENEDAGFLEPKLPFWIPAAIAAGAVVLILTLIAVIFTSRVGKLDTTFPNLYVDGIPVGGMTLEEVEDTLSGATLAAGEDSEAVVNILDTYTVSVKAADVGVVPTVEAVAEMAFEWGKHGTVYTRAMRWVHCRGHVTDLSSVDAGELDEEAVKASVETQCAAIAKKAVDSDYEIGKDSITVTKAVGGITIDTAKVQKLILRQLKTGDYTPVDYEAKVTEPKEVDLQKIYDEIFVEPKDAEYDAKTGKVTASVTGVSFDLKAAQAKFEKLKPGESMTVKLIYTEPEVVAEEGETAYPDVLSECHSSMSGSSDSRKNNITLACEACDGTVLMPGDEFSFNETVGERTAAKGYEEAGAFAGGQSVSQVGGGICQMSSTIYGCVLYANLTATERECHMFMIGYLPNGQDATVDWGHLDLKFVNTRNYPILMHCWIDGDEVNCEFLGTKEDDNYVVLDSYPVEWNAYQTVYKESNEVTTQQVQQTGVDGASYVTYRYLYDKDGNLLNEEYISYDVYERRDTVVLVPAAAATPTPTAEPTAVPTAEPTPEVTPTPEPTAEPTPEPTPTPTEAPSEETNPPE